jgi:hypothetical protein
MGRLASVSTLLMIVGLPNRPLTAGKGGAGTRHAAFSLDAVDQSGLFAANERPRPHLDQDLQVDARAEDVVPQQVVRFGVGDGRLEPLDGQGIFGPKVHIGLRGADRIGGDGHAFDQAMRIALDNGAVHERPGIAFIGVADQVFLIAGRLPGEFPFLARWKASAASTSQSALLDHVAHRLGRHAAQNFHQRRVASPGDVLFDPSRIDQAAVGQHPASLRREERMLVEIGDIRPGRERLAPKLAESHFVGNGARENGFQQGGNLVGRDMLEADSRAAGQLDVDQRFGGTKPDATDHHDVGLDFAAVEECVDGG